MKNHVENSGLGDPNSQHKIVIFLSVNSSPPNPNLHCE